MTIEFNHLNLIDLHAICDNADWLKLSTTVIDCKRCDGLSLNARRQICFRQNESKSFI